MKIDWERHIQELVSVQRKVSESEGRNPPRPQPPATEAQLAAAEAKLGLSLDPQYRDFLRHANGWDDILGDTLFGTGELLDTTGLMATATSAISAFVEFNPSGMFPEDEGPLEEWETRSPLNTISPKDVLPIGYCAWYLSIIMIGRERTSCAGQVLHISGSAVNRYPDFRSFFQNAIQYERSRIKQSEAS